MCCGNNGSVQSKASPRFLDGNYNFVATNPYQPAESSFGIIPETTYSLTCTGKEVQTSPFQVTAVGFPTSSSTRFCVPAPSKWSIEASQPIYLRADIDNCYDIQVAHLDTSSIYIFSNIQAQCHQKPEGYKWYFTPQSGGIVSVNLTPIWT
jgi:hypothetical protein